jgi:hypothetical protein
VPTIKTFKKRLSTAGFGQNMGQVERLNVSNIMAEDAQSVGVILHVAEHDTDHHFVLGANAIIDVDVHSEASEMTHIHWGAIVIAASPKTIVEEQRLKLLDNLIST